MRGILATIEEIEMKKALIILAAFALALTWAGNVGAAPLQESGFEYLLAEDETATVTRYLGTAEELTVPDALGGFPVKRIEEYAFANNDRLKAVFLPEGLETIGLRAFVGCYNLKDIRIPAGVNSIGNSAFLLTGIAKITVDPANPAYRAVDGVLFHLPTSTLHTYPSARDGSEYRVPDGTLAIENGAFSHVPALGKVILPDSLTNISGSAFLGSPNLISLAIPAGVLSIGSAAFKGTGLEAMEVADGNPAYEQRDGVLFERATGNLHTYPPRRQAMDYQIPSDTLGILPNAFSECEGPERLVYPEGMKTTFYSVCYYNSGLREVVLPESMETIDAYSFYYCKNLRDVAIPSGVTAIKYCAFAGCENLKELALPEGLTQIEGSAFNGCVQLESLDLPDSLEAVGELAFLDCPKLIITAGAGTFAQQYAEANGIPYKTR